jgi:hypothetical protein
MEADVKPHDLTRPFTGSTVLSIWVTTVLTLYSGGAFALAMARHLDGPSVALTGVGVALFAAMTAWNLRLLHEERQVQSEYSLTASRHISKPVRSP